MSKVRAAAAPAPEAFAACEPKRTLAFECKCGCDLFRLDVAITAQHDWYTLLLCAACGTACMPTEPITNGPH